MRRRHGHGGKGFMIGAVLGSLVGGITALLYAPKSGKKMRKDVSRKCNEMCERAECLVEKAKDLADDAKKSTRSMMKKLRK